MSHTTSTIYNVIPGGTSGNDTLTGTSGNDLLDGHAGADTLIGGLGNDAYVVDNIGDIVTELPNEGTDVVRSTITYTLTDNVENLSLLGTAAINGTGNALNNTLFGNSAANSLTGGAGDDVYVVGIGDSVTEGLDAGTDTVRSSISYTLTANVEKLSLLGAAAINGTGNTLNNTLTGNSAANSLTGGAGNDVYVVGIGDSVTEGLDAGTDTVRSSISYTLTANVEKLSLLGTAAIDGTGNALNNTLTGNSAANVLTGGAGDDVYVMGIGDSVTEGLDAGTDTVRSSISYTLTDNVEKLSLLGTAAIDGTGNALNNTLTGNSAANSLTGGAGTDILNGGAGEDHLIGGIGKDYYTLTETVAATDMLHIAAGESLPLFVDGFDVVNGFKLGINASSTTGVDKLDLASILITADSVADGSSDQGVLHSHSISNGLISFDDVDTYAAPLALTDGNLVTVLNYLEANNVLAADNTVAFNAGGNTYIFQDGGANDTLVKLTGVTAVSISTGVGGIVATDAVWIS